MQNPAEAKSQQYVIYAILAFGVLECLILGLVLLEPPPANATGIPHPSIPSMVIGGDNSRFSFIADYAWWFQVFALAQAHCLAALGVKAEKRTGTFFVLLFGSYLLALFVWWQMVAGYEQFIATGETAFAFGFPYATAWQTYGLWISGMGLMLIYSLGFRHYVWSDEDQSKFEALVTKTAPQDTQTKGEGA
jgi:hypothetical protein